MENATQELETEEVTATPGSTARPNREVKTRTRKRFSAEEKIRIVLEGFRREIPVSELCRKENISSCLYYSWLKDFMEAGKSQLKVSPFLDEDSLISGSSSIRGSSMWAGLS